MTTPSEKNRRNAQAKRKAKTTPLMNEYFYKVTTQGNHWTGIVESTNAFGALKLLSDKFEDFNGAWEIMIFNKV